MTPCTRRDLTCCARPRLSGRAALSRQCSGFRPAGRGHAAQLNVKTALNSRPMRRAALDPVPVFDAPVLTDGLSAGDLAWIACYLATIGLSNLWWRLENCFLGDAELPAVGSEHQWCHLVPRRHRRCGWYSDWDCCRRLCPTGTDRHRGPDRHPSTRVAGRPLVGLTCRRLGLLHRLRVRHRDVDLHAHRVVVRQYPRNRLNGDDHRVLRDAVESLVRSPPESGRWGPVRIPARRANRRPAGSGQHR